MRQAGGPDTETTYIRRAAIAVAEILPEDPGRALQVLEMAGLAVRALDRPVDSERVSFLQAAPDEIVA
jgi:phage tail sheath gpL-like